MRTLLIAVLVLSSALAWADPASDLAACQAQARQTEQGRDAYVLQLGKALAELHEQLDQARQQMQSLTQEVQRLKAPTAKPDEKK